MQSSLFGMGRGEYPRQTILEFKNIFLLSKLIYNFWIQPRVMKYVIQTIFCICLFIALNAQKENTKKIYPSLDSLLGIKTIGDAVISPDGKNIAYEIYKANFETDNWDTQIWLIETSTGNTTQLTMNKNSSWSPKWSSDNKWIAYISPDANGNDQVFIISSVSKQVIQLTNASAGVYDFAWSNNNKYIAYTSAATIPEQLKKRKEYGNFTVVDKDEVSLTHLWFISVDSALQKPYEGTEVSGNISVSGWANPFAWSNDDSKIAFSGTSTDSKETGQDIFIFSIQDNKIQRVISQKGRDRDPQWSPDNKQIIFTSDMARKGLEGWNFKLAIVPVTGGNPISVTEEFDELPRLIKWNNNGIYFSAAQKTASHLFILNPNTKFFKRITQPDDLSAGGFSISKDGTQLAFIASSNTTINEVYISNMNNFNATKLTKMSDQISHYILADKEIISWTSTDGQKIEGVLTKPKDFSANKKYPLLVDIHSGPQGINNTNLLGWFYYPFDLWINRGALVLQINYRGSGGYGKKFRFDITYRNFDMEAEDILSGIDYLNRKGWIDTTRMGCMGWSHGGYLTAFIGLKTNKFKAISVGAGISDWAAHYYSPSKDLVLNYLGYTPMEDPAIYKKLSPITYIKQASTATLIQHGDRDQTVNIQNAYALYNGLLQQNVRVEMIVYNGSGHNISTPKTLKAAMEHNFYWFNHYIFGDPLPDFTKRLSEK